MSVALAGPHEIDGAWNNIGPMLQRACDRVPSDINVPELWQLCRSGNAFLVFAAHEKKLQMVSVWQFQKDDNGALLKCLCLAGDEREEWLEEATKIIFQMASDNGVKRIRYEGREGWEKLFPQSKLISRIYEIEV